MNMRFILYLIVAAGIFGSAQGQDIVLDRPVKAGELTLFPSMEDPKSFYYLTDKPKIATGSNGKPQFSFLRYVSNAESGSDGDGGGIVTALVVLEVSEEQRNRAEQELQQIVSGGKLVGPVVYRDGRIALISSVAQPNGEFAKQVIGLGKAPILDGHKAAISVELTKRGAQLLHASFQTPTPDMSFSFEMVVSGYRMPKKAIIEANFDMIYEHKAFRAAVAAPIIQAEVNMAFDDLVQSGAIKVINKGADEQMEKLIEDAYNKLTRMMFEPSGGTGTPNLGQLAATAGGQPSMLDRASTLLNASRTEARADNAAAREEARRAGERGESDGSPSGATDSTRSGGAGPRPYFLQTSSREPSAHAAGRASEPAAERSVPQIAIAASFEMKKVRQRGMYRIDLEKWSTDNMNLRFDENFGAIKCAECFIDVNLDDPLYKQRELIASLDGMNAKDFGEFINFVNVTMVKEHQSGDVTTEEVKIDRHNFNETGNKFNLIYGFKGDSDRSKWASYKFKTVWNFFGGATIESGWQDSDIQVIPLSPPYVTREILVDSDPGKIVDNNVRAIEIKVFYMVGSNKLNKNLTLNTNQEQFTGKFDIITPREGTDYDYEITWYFKDGTMKSSGLKKGTSTLLFADQFS